MESACVTAHRDEGEVEKSGRRLLQSPFHDPAIFYARASWWTSWFEGRDGEDVWRAASVRPRMGAGRRCAAAPGVMEAAREARGPRDPTRTEAPPRRRPPPPRRGRRHDRRRHQRRPRAPPSRHRRRGPTSRRCWACRFGPTACTSRRSATRTPIARRPGIAEALRLAPGTSSYPPGQASCLGSGSPTPSPGSASEASTLTRRFLSRHHAVGPKAPVNARNWGRLALIDRCVWAHDELMSVDDRAIRDKRSRR